MMGPFPWKGATTAPSTHAHHATPVQPYGHGGSKSANYPSVKKQAQTDKVLRKLAPAILLTAAVVALGIGIIACSLATAGVCAVAFGVEAEAGAVAADADAIGSAIAAESEAQAAAEAGTAASDGLAPQAAKSISSSEKLIAEHEAKLKAHRADPLAYDNKGFLAKALKDGDAERYNRIVNRRIDHLNDEIKTFNDSIDKIQERGQ